MTMRPSIRLIFPPASFLLQRIRRSRTGPVGICAPTLRALQRRDPNFAMVRAYISNRTRKDRYLRRNRKIAKAGGRTRSARAGRHRHRHRTAAGERIGGELFADAADRATAF